MGFFGFLKKKKALDAPQKPEAKGLETQGSTSAGPGALGDPFSIPQEAPASPPGAATPTLPGLDDVPPAPTLDAPPHPPPPDLFPDAETHFTQDVTGETSETGTKPEEPAQEAGPELASIPEESRGAAALPEIPEGLQATDIPEATDAPEVLSTPELPPLEKSAAEKGEAATKQDQEGAVGAPDDLPDFSEEELEKAKMVSEKPEPVTYELPSLDEELPPPTQPVRERPDELYLPAAAYREAIENAKRLKSAAQKGRTAMNKMITSIGEHEQKYQKFADALNDIQESLLAMESILER